MAVFVVKSEYAFGKSERFSSYEELSQRLILHSKHDYVYYWRRDSRTVEGAYLKTARFISKKLKYYSVKYACVFGGQKFASRGRGERSTHNQTKRMNCPAFISLRASKSGKYLQVMQVCNEHNHEISEDAIKQIPHPRKLTPEVKDEVLHLLSQNFARDEIIKYVRLRAGVQLISKTINNFAIELKTQKKILPNALVVERIQQFLETNQISLRTDFSHRNDEAIFEPGEIIQMECTEDVLEPYIDSLIEEKYDSFIELDSTIEFTDGNCETVIVGEDETLHHIIESIQPSERLEREQKTKKNRCENFAMAHSARSLQTEINRLRQMKRQLIRETNDLKRKKHKILIEINHLESSEVVCSSMAEVEGG